MTDSQNIGELQRSSPTSQPAELKLLVLGFCLFECLKTHIRLSEGCGFAQLEAPPHQDGPTQGFFLVTAAVACWGLRLGSKLNPGLLTYSGGPGVGLLQLLSVFCCIRAFSCLCLPAFLAA